MLFNCHIFIAAPPRPKFHHGQIVQVTQNKELFRFLQVSLGLWEDGMEKVNTFEYSSILIFSY